VWGFLAGLPPWTRAGLFGLVYFAGAELGNVLSFQPSNVATFWPPAGLFVAVLLLSDLRAWPAFLLAAFPANIAFDLLHGRPLWASVLFTVGNGLEALVGAWLVRRFVGERPALASAKEVLGLAVLSAGLSTTLGATIGSATVLAAYGGDSLWRVWRVWWSGDALGVLVFAPVILTWVAGREAGGEPHAPSGLPEFTLLLVGMTAGAWCVFSNVSMGHQFDYLVIPFLLWAALRFGPRGNATAGLVLALVAAWSSTRGSNGVPPGGMHLADHILWLQAFLGVALLTALTLAAVLEERKRAEAALAEQTRQLEGVRAVTAEITRELDLTLLLDLIHRRAAGLVGAVSGAVFLWDEAAQSLIPHAAHGFGEWRWDLPFRLGEGVVGVAAQRREGLMVNDYRASPYTHPLVLDRTAITAVMAEPLLYQERLLGGIVVSHQEPGRRFTERDRETLALFAAQAAIAIENARLLQQEQERCRHLEAVRAISEEVTRELDLSRLLNLIIQRTAELVGAASGAVYLWEEPAHVLVPRAWSGFGDWIRDARIHPGEGITGTVAERREGLIVNDYPTSPFHSPFFTEHADIRAVVAEPLLYQNRLVGVVTLNNGENGRPFTERDRETLTLFATQAAIAIENARLYASAEKRRAQIEAVRAVTTEITRELDLTTLLRLIAERALELVGAGRNMIRLWDEKTQLLVARAWTGGDADRAIVPLRLGEGVAGTAALRREGMIVNDFRNSPYAAPSLLQGTTHTAVLAEPLLYHDRLVGVINIAREAAQAPFTEEDRHLLGLFAAQAAIAIENARLYEEVQRHAGDLEVRVQERTRDLEEAVRQAEAASAAKSDFLANMSHELRTPLNSVIGFSELLQGLSFGPLSERQARFVTNIHTSGKHLLNIVTDILDLTKVEAEKLTLQYESFEVEPVLEEVVTLVREVAVKKSQALTVNIAPGLPPLSADPMRFRQICFNLLSNAVKFTAPGGAVRVTARQICDLKSGDSEPQSQIANPKSEILPSPPQSAIRNRQSAIESSWLELSVADTGMGIKPEDMPRLFQEFVQLEPAMTKHHEGTGLGLALAKRLVELHGGRIWATSPGEGQGSTFTVLLPFEGPVGRKQEAGGS
jgi:signal transduction histidine kinase/integral membrane sensor domain MASE1